MSNECKFKVGDKVKCVDHSRSRGELCEELVYEVDGVVNDLGVFSLHLKSVPSTYFEHRFELYEAAPAPTPAARITTDSDARKTIPVASGCLDYFPDAIAAVAELSFRGNEKHNPGQPMHWARAKSTDEADCLIRHFLERGTVDTDGIRHSVKVAWRALALLQKEIEATLGLPISRGSK